MKLLPAGSWIKRFLTGKVMFIILISSQERISLFVLLLPPQVPHLHD